MFLVFKFSLAVTIGSPVDDWRGLALVLAIVAAWTQLKVRPPVLYSSGPMHELNAILTYSWAMIEAEILPIILKV